MNETASEVATDIAYLIDKFNVTIDLTGKQIQEFSEQFVRKIIYWEIITSIAIIIVSIAIILAIIVVKKKDNKIKKQLDFIKKCSGLDDTSSDFILYKIFNAALAFIVIICAINIISNTCDLVLCASFPEKIVLQFISNYI